MIRTVTVATGDWDMEGELFDMSDFIVSGVAEEISNMWADEAHNSLNKTRAGYIEGLSVEREGRAKYAVVLRGELNVMVELGSTPYDMKRFLLKGGGSKVIPLGFSKRSGAKSSKNTSRSVVGIGVPAAGNLPSNFKGLRHKITKPAVDGISVSSYEHSRKAYAGLRGGGAKGSGSDYTMFRTVSKNSDPSSWIHPGITARLLHEKVLDKLDIDGVVAKYKMS